MPGTRGGGEGAPDGPLNLLFTNIGRRTYFLEFALELKREGYPLNVFVADASRRTAGFWVSEDIQSFLTPRVTDAPDRYAEVLLDRASERGINLIVPLLDFELPVLAQRRPDFAARGITVVVSPAHVVDVCMDKKANYEFCREHGVPTPDTFFSREATPHAFPLVVKRIRGSAGVGLKVVQDEQGLSGVDYATELVQRHISGAEYGLDILNDLDGNPLAVSVKRKLLMRSGETDKAIVVRHPRIEELAARVSRAFGHVGNMDVDVIEDDHGALYCIDFNPRFGGGYPATHVSGLNYLKAIVDMHLGRRPTLPAQKLNTVVLKGISIVAYQAGAADEE